MDKRLGRMVWCCQHIRKHSTELTDSNCHFGNPNFEAVSLHLAWMAILARQQEALPGLSFKTATHVVDWELLRDLPLPWAEKNTFDDLFPMPQFFLCFVRDAIPKVEAVLLESGKSGDGREQLDGLG